MTDANKFPYWLAIEDGKTIRFSNLSHLMAKAMHPASDVAYFGALANLEHELPKAVQRGELVVRNPLDMDKHTFPFGDALNRAVMLPHDLRPFLESRGIELRVTPHGNGPACWTIENAALAIAEQEGWHGGTRAKFQDDLKDAATSGALVILDPRTCLPTRPDLVRTFWELLTPEHVNTWLATLKAPYRWSPLEPTAEKPGREATHPTDHSPGPEPLTTGDIAYCLAGLRWSEQGWKKPLGDKPKWLKACVALPGVRGVSETRWNPVLIGAALVRSGHVGARSVRAKFQSQRLLLAWLEHWKTYEADNFDNE